MSDSAPVADVFPLLWVADVAALADWAVATLGLTESWRAPNEAGVVEHAELRWLGGCVSINVQAPSYAGMGPSGIALRYDDPAEIDRVHQRAVAAGAEIIQGPETSPIAYSFTARDPVGNQWWVHAETGMLDELRSAGPAS